MDKVTAPVTFEIWKELLYIYSYQGGLLSAEKGLRFQPDALEC